MTDKKFHTTFEEMTKAMKDNYMAHGEIHPFLFVNLIDEKGNRGQAICPVLGEFIESSENRQKFMYIIGQQMLKNKDIAHVDSVIFISEAWTVKLSKKESEEFKNGNFESPSKHPNRIEIATIMAMSDKSELLIQAFEMLDKKNKEKRSLKPIEEIGENGQKLESNLLLAFWRGMGIVK